MDLYETSVLRTRKRTLFQRFVDFLNRHGIIWPKYYKIQTYPQPVTGRFVGSPAPALYSLPQMVEYHGMGIERDICRDLLWMKSRNRKIKIELHRYNRQKFGRRSAR